MAILLLIETSADVCSVALSGNGKIIACKEITEGKNHASVITLFIDEIIKQTGILLTDIDAVAVNAGPGSYTGLRIGLSTVKGLCFALDKPLILIDALTSLCNGITGENKLRDDELICPVIDNRRDEIFYALFNSQGEMLRPVTLSNTSDEEFLKIINDTNVIFTGSGIDKIKKGNETTNKYLPLTPSAKYLLKTAEEKFIRNDFADVAYSEPLYYKGVYIEKNKSAVK